MNGPQHYVEAERLARAAEGQNLTPEGAAAYAATAQAHATLALVAALVAGRGLGPQESWGGRHLEILSPANEAWERVTQ